MRPTHHAAPVPLTFLLPGTEVRVEEIDDAIDSTQREQLVAYGLAPHRPLVVLQQRPVTIVMLDAVELALEASVAHHVWVRRATTAGNPTQLVFSSSRARPQRHGFAISALPVAQLLGRSIAKIMHALCLKRNFNA